ncbi:App1 family protein [Dokdonia sp. Hel_I_53]|uniref:App1 family protein n=1 Tax=Dokdonia sp. Hel_I_53 TaxID=1566287 RepID=UPI001199EE36|nr:App1 family protein [Dokdonia sp. Hel_I_53]TVZ52844.1 phosphatidate phosphatase APP1 [Dokdonia sp. Hel_I_53]
MEVDISVYRGYMNERELVISGHVFNSWAPSQYSIERRSVKHAYSILKMFTIKPQHNVRVTLKFRALSVTTQTLNDGYFEFKVPYSDVVESGWHTCEVICEHKKFNIVTTGEFLKPFTSCYGIISDIDDTFLVSHSSNIFKKLYVMLWQNLDKREVFDDVPKHYQALSRAGQLEAGSFNSFFYVSSSEWNLYSFIVAISKKYELPKAVILLKKIKTGLADFFNTGGGNHNHKFDKIKKIITFYPDIEYILLGDDSQKDPYIYERICKEFPENINAIYIRRTGSEQKPAVETILNTIKSSGVQTLYFVNSRDAIAHSHDIGII